MKALKGFMFLAFCCCVSLSTAAATEEKKEMPILLTRPELELERSFDLNNPKDKI